jgi:hypothetical protein
MEVVSTRLHFLMPGSAVGHHQLQYWCLQTDGGPGRGCHPLLVERRLALPLGSRSKPGSLVRASSLILALSGFFAIAIQLISDQEQANASERV